jgi:DNA polymerase III epsilon subunit-like protein
MRNHTMKLAFIDTETTELDPNKAAILEIAIIRVEEGVEVDRYHSLVKPTKEEMINSNPKSLAINGYDPERWKDAPSIEEIAERVVAILDNCTLVGHNVSFDESMIKAVFLRHGINKKIPYHKIDTVTLVFEHLFPIGLRRASLDSVRDFLGWDKRGSHTALKDTEDVMKLYNTLWRMSFLGSLVLRIKSWFNRK